MNNIPFNRPCVLGPELSNIEQVMKNHKISGDGSFTKACNRWFEEHFGAKKALIVHSGTAALEMAALLCDIKPGDEFICPSYTFVSTANAFVLRGAVPVFVDVHPETMNMDETKIEAAITPRTKVIVPVHYAGVACEMDTIMEIAARHNLLVVEDAAQGVYSTYKGRPLGTIGHMGCYSFHETKNFICGEGGAIVINDDRFIERAEIIREKGTNRSLFFRGMVDKYTWVDVGSSYLPSELNAAYLLPQLENADGITENRMAAWNEYHRLLAPLEAAGKLRRPIIPDTCGHNAHMYYILLPDLETRTNLIAKLKENSILSVFHYIPLHTAPKGLELTGGVAASLPVTEEYADRLLRLPLYYGLTQEDVTRICSIIEEQLK